MSTTASPEVTGGGPVTTRLVHVYRVRLDRPGLDAAIRVATERFTRTQVVLRSERNGTRFSGGSLIGLCAQIDRSSEQGDPDRLDNLQVECRARERSVTLVIADDRATLTVSGRDAAWTYGKAEQVRSLLLRSGASERPVRGGPKAGGLVGAVGAAIIAGATIAVSGGRPEPPSITLAVVFVLLAAAAGALTGRRRVRRAKVNLYIAGPQPKLSLWARMTIMERLLACSTLAGLVGLVLNVMKI